jgi:peptide/nickel transport system permease protein
MALIHYVIKRLIYALVVLIIIASIDFLIFQFIPEFVLGLNPATLLLGQFANRIHEAGALEKVLISIENTYGLNQPWDIRYVKYIENMFTFNFGISLDLSTGTAVSLVISRALPNTVALVGSATIVAALVGIALGVVAAAKRGKAGDIAIVDTGLLFFSMPSFWLGLILLVFFGAYLKIFCVSQSICTVDRVGLAYLHGYIMALILPVISLTLITLGTYLLIMRSNLIDVFTEDYINIARAKGVPERTILFKHAFRNAVLPVVSVVGLSLGFILGGAVITETVFSWPGLGLTIISAVDGSDYPVEQAIFFIIALMVVVGNLITDLLYAALDPRIRY